MKSIMWAFSTLASSLPIAGPRETMKQQCLYTCFLAMSLSLLCLAVQYISFLGPICSHFVSLNLRAEQTSSAGGARTVRHTFFKYSKDGMQGSIEIRGLSLGIYK